MSDSSSRELLPYLNRRDTVTLWLVDENFATDVLSAIRPHEGLRAVTNRYDIQQVLSRHGIDTLLSDFDLQACRKPVGAVIYRVSKERHLVHHCINQSFEALEPGGKLILSGEKNEGIKTHGKNAGKVFGAAARVHKNGLNYSVVIEKHSQAAETYLDSNDYPRLREITAPELTFVSKPGVFGWNKVDRGSVLLANTLRAQQPVNSSRFHACLDLGCGYGYLLLATQDYAMDYRAATDNNVAAITAAEANFARAGMKVTTVLDDAGSTITEKFDLILCNPPFHRGFAHHKPLTEEFLRRAAELLAPRGQAYFVVNQFVPLEKAAANYFSQVHHLSGDGSFNVFQLK